MCALLCVQVNTTKFEKRLEDVAHKWDDIKKAQPQVKNDVEPIQVSEQERIKKDVDTFAGKVGFIQCREQSRASFENTKNTALGTSQCFSYASGPDQAVWQ